MKRWGPAIGAGLATIFTSVLAVMSFGFASDAQGSLDDARGLYDARVEVADAQDRLQGTDLRSAIESARQANKVALRVGRVTSRIAELVEDAQAAVEALIGTSERGARSAVFASRQLDAAAGILAEISGYQQQANRSSKKTNAALRKVLHALRDTNRSFPGGGS